MRRGNLQRSLAALVTGVLLFASAKAFAADVSAGWKTECVGRFQLNLPGEVEVALTHLSSFTEANPVNPHRFADMTPAPHTKGFAVSYPISQEEFQKFKKDFSVEREETKKALIAESKPGIATQTCPDNDDGSISPKLKSIPLSFPSRRISVI